MEAFKKTGMWDPYVPNYRADWDYYYRMEMSGYQTVNVQDMLKRKILHGNSMTLKSLHKLSHEQKYGWWLTDLIGRYVYFQVKWDSGAPPEKDTEGAYRVPFGGKSPSFEIPV